MRCERRSCCWPGPRVAEPAEAAPDFRHVRAWVFDLDNTLYPSECDLFAQIDSRMGAFVAEFLGIGFEEAKRVQKDYYYRYGTTLAGMMREHKLPAERIPTIIAGIPTPRSAPDSAAFHPLNTILFQ